MEINSNLQGARGNVKTFFQEFKQFAVKGNVIDLAVAVVIGTAFNKIVESLVNDIIMQAIAAAFGKPDFSELVWSIRGGELKIGSFLNNIINFIIVALSVFVAIKLVNKFLPDRNTDAHEGDGKTEGSQSATK